jgi:imidazolonepropionase-like amidohydrolase
MHAVVIASVLWTLGAMALHAQPVTALVGGTLIDGFGGPPIRNSVIVIRGERIEAVGQVGSLTVPADAQVISTEGMSVLPGLWDMHVHLMLAGHADYAHWDSTYPSIVASTIMPSGAKQLLMAGITSARTGAPRASIQVRDRINRGEIPDPRLRLGTVHPARAYPGTGRSGGCHRRATRARRSAAGRGRGGRHQVDRQDQMTAEEVAAVVDEAHRHRLPVVAHSHRPKRSAAARRRRGHSNTRASNGTSIRRTSWRSSVSVRPR